MTIIFNLSFRTEVQSWLKKKHTEGSEVGLLLDQETTFPKHNCSWKFMETFLVPHNWNMEIDCIGDRVLFDYWVQQHFNERASIASFRLKIPYNLLIFELYTMIHLYSKSTESLGQHKPYRKSPLEPIWS